MRVAVTGAGGFLGSHVVRTALAWGHDVTVLLRPGSRAELLSGLPLERVFGDLAEEHLPDGFLGSADAVIHAAAAYSENPNDRDLLWRVNVQAVQRLLVAARDHGVGRFVHVSTMGTCAPASHGGPATEADVVASERSSAYAASKLEGERCALAARGIDVVVVNPGALVGAGDLKPSVTGRRVLSVFQGRVPHLLEGPVNHVCVAGCAEGILLALDRGRPRARYLLGGENLWPAQFLERCAKAAGRSPPRRSAIEWLLRRKRPRPGNLAIDDALARRELGYRPGDLDEAFAAAMTDLRTRAATH